MWDKWWMRQKTCSKQEFSKQFWNCSFSSKAPRKVFFSQLESCIETASLSATQRKGWNFQRDFLLNYNLEVLSFLQLHTFHTTFLSQITFLFFTVKYTHLNPKFVENLDLIMFSKMKIFGVFDWRRNFYCIGIFKILINFYVWSHT